MRTKLALAVATALLLAGTAMAQTVKIGVLTDLSSVAVDDMGPGSVLAAQMAAEDFGGTVNGMKIEIVSGDHQQKPDVGASIVRRWFDQENVDMVADVPNSAVTLAIQAIARNANKVLLPSGSQASDVTGAQCSPNTVRWTIDVYATSHSLPAALMKEGGNKNWFFVHADVAYGHDLVRQAGEAVAEAGGKVIEAVAHPIGIADFSSFVVRAKGSKADVIGVANFSADLTNFLKQSAEFGLMRGSKIAAFVLGVNNVRAVGLNLTQGLYTATPFYWDRDDATRAFAARFAPRHPRNLYPNEWTTGVYASVTHYLKAVQAVGSAKDGRAVVAKMKELPTDDPFFGKGVVRMDGSVMHPIYLYQVKSPAESKGPWDLFKLVTTLPGETAFGPMNKACPLVAQR